MDYKNSGVDVEAGRAFVDRIRSSVEATRRLEVIGGMGGFGGCIRLPAGMVNPVLIAGTDGVGTKLELAQRYKDHLGVGIDLVAMCVNDVITSSAEPLFFLDYMATGVLAENDMAQVVEGISQGCLESGCTLLGGETAEMPGFYPKGRYDLAGFCVAVVEEENLVDGKKMQDGDHIIGIASSGVHSNGFSLVRKIIEKGNIDEKTEFGKDNSLLIEELMKPTIIYAGLVKSLMEAKLSVRGMAHITGGGLPENLPRCLPPGLQACIDTLSWKKPQLFQWLQEAGQIPEKDLWHTFNLGVGFCIVLPSTQVQPALEVCKKHCLEAWEMGKVKECLPASSKTLEGLPF